MTKAPGADQRLRPRRLNDFAQHTVWRVRTTERVELEAMRDHFAVAPAEVRAELRSAGSAIALRVASLPQVTELNRVLGLSSGAELDQLSSLYGEAPFTVSVDPEAGLDGSLRERGFAAGYPWHKFERGVQPAEARTALSVEAPRRPEDFGDTFAAGYGLPASAAAWVTRVVARKGWHCFVAYDGDEPAGVGALFIDGDAGWLGFGATRPAKRGRGAQNAVLAARVNRGAELGLRKLVTETGAPREDGPGPSYRNILRAGFEFAYERPNYRAPTSGR
jgi:hypothetical protein